MKAEMPQGVAPKLQGRVSGGAGAAIEAAENLSRDVAAGRGGPGLAQSGWGMSTVYGSTYGVSHMKRHQGVPRPRSQSLGPSTKRPYSTTEVPDFAALHEKQRRDRQRYSNRVATQPEPFVFTGPSRSLRSRQPPLLKDPSKDPRYHKKTRARPQSAPGVRPTAAERYAAGVDGAGPAIKALERPPVIGRPGTTAKTLAYQQYRAEELMQKRADRAEKEDRLEKAYRVDPEMHARVRRAVGPVEDPEERLNRKVEDLKQSQRSTKKEKTKELAAMASKVERRPLLMQQTDSVARARRQALFQFRGFLKDAGVENPDAHFEDDELDELDRAKADQDM